MSESDNPYRYYLVTATRLVEEEELDSDDLDVPASWDGELPPEALEENWSPGRCATYVLDDFHDSVAIAVLDDFEIRVFDPDGEEIWEEDDTLDLSEPVVEPSRPAGPRM